MSKKLIIRLSWLNLVLFTISAIFMSIFLLQMVSKTPSTEIQNLLDILMKNVPQQEQIRSFHTLGIWISITVLCVLIIGIPGILLLRNDHHRRFAGVLLLSCGLLILLGTYYIGVFFAVIFFLLGFISLFIKRKEE